MFGTIGNLKTSYQKITTVAESDRLEAQKARAENVLAKFRGVADDLVSLNDTPADKLPDDPRKVIAKRGESVRPRFESSTAQTAFKVAQFLFPPLFLMRSETFDKPSLSGVAEMNDNAVPTRLNAELGPNPETGESKQVFDYQIADDGTEKYTVTSYTPVTVADAWDRGKPLGQVSHVALPTTETVALKDGELTYEAHQPRLSSRPTRLELFEKGLSLK